MLFRSVPSPNVTNDHQRKNAAVLEAQGAVRMILEEDCGGASLYQETARLLEEGETRREMERAIGAAGIADASERIYQILLKLLQKR